METRKGHTGSYSGNHPRHSKHHMVNSWEEEDVKRGRKEMAEGHKGHAEALFDDAHGSYNWNGHNSTGAEHHGPAKTDPKNDSMRKSKPNRARGEELSDAKKCPKGQILVDGKCVTPTKPPKV